MERSRERVLDYARRVRARETILGYWVIIDSPVSTERLARLGYDYVCFDAQHGLLDYKGILAGMTAIDAGGESVGMVRVGANDPFLIGQALDAGAAGIIVPLVNTAEDAARAVVVREVPAPRHPLLRARCARSCGSAPTRPTPTTRPSCSP